MKSIARTQKRHGSCRRGRTRVEALEEESQDERCAAVHKRAEPRLGLFGVLPLSRQKRWRIRTQRRWNEMVLRKHRRTKTRKTDQIWGNTTSRIRMFSGACLSLVGKISLWILLC